MTESQIRFFNRMSKVYKHLEKHKKMEVERTITPSLLRRHAQRDNLYVANRHSRTYQKAFYAIFDDASPIHACQWFEENEHMQSDTFVLFAMSIKEFAQKNRVDEQYPELFV